MANLGLMQKITSSATADLYYDFSETLSFYISGQFTVASPPPAGSSADFSSLDFKSSDFSERVIAQPGAGFSAGDFSGDFRGLDFNVAIAASVTVYKGTFLVSPVFAMQFCAQAKPTRFNPLSLALGNYYFSGFSSSPSTPTPA